MQSLIRHRVLLMMMMLLTINAAHAAESARRPNVVFILADDLGWRDTSLYGSKFCETPHIDRLAKRGVMFTQAYSANPLCSPTRASILTGLYPGRIGITAPVGHLPEERFEASLVARAQPTQKALQQISATRLKHEYVTLAETLKEAGYATGHFGKWHLGHEPYDPLHQGFDVDVPHTPGPGPAGSYVAPWRFPPQLNFVGQPGEHIEDRMAQEAVKFIKANKDRPFFLNYWAFSVHSPWGAKENLIEKYKAKADPNSPQRNPLYAAMVQSLDEAVGKLLDTLDELKITDNTIIIFFSDNGGVHWFEPSMKERFGMDSPPTSNAPLRGGKATLYEGGTREPCIVVWQGKVKAGTKSDAFLSSVDFYPTILEMVGVKVGDSLRESKTRSRSERATLDGVSQVSALLGTGNPRDTLFCFFPHYTPATGNLPGTWVRRGDWKLIRFHHDNDDQTDRFELYNLKDDIGETKNLAAAMPDKVKELNALIEQHLKDIHALVPTPNPNYRKGGGDWTSSRDATIEFKDKQLVITSTGGDPFIITRDVPNVKGPFTIEFRMKSNSKGNVQVFWATAKDQPLFFRDRSVIFSPKHDNEWHDYEIKLPVQDAVIALRLDPSTAPGEVRMEWMRLKDGEGKTVKEWRF